MSNNIEWTDARIHPEVMLCRDLDSTLSETDSELALTVNGIAIHGTKNQLLYWAYAAINALAAYAPDPEVLPIPEMGAEFDGGTVLHSAIVDEPDGGKWLLLIFRPGPTFLAGTYTDTGEPRMRSGWNTISEALAEFHRIETGDEDHDA